EGPAKKHHSKADSGWQRIGAADHQFQHARVLAAERNRSVDAERVHLQPDQELPVGDSRGQRASHLDRRGEPVLNSRRGYPHRHPESLLLAHLTPPPARSAVS
ncbi:hypothetical protein, partial [Mycobacterium tuberculosis]|uniref:hypothetical protein n=1 Tax=Mycobacterium tuberculosis TaxID=1773 RepID=UPI003F4A9091